MKSSFDIRVLGPLHLRSGDSIPTPTAPKERELLALLLMNSGQVVPISTMIDELWPERPPKTAITALQTYVLNIRRSLSIALGLHGPDVRNELLLTKNKGYVFHTETCDFDLTQYRELVLAGRRALREGDRHLGVGILRQAEGLWRGRPLSDVDQGSPLRAEIAGLEQSRSAARALRIEADLRLGHHRFLLAELAELIAEYPFDENLHASYMVALQRSGFREKALEVFQRLHRAMTEQIGLEPGQELQLLRREILASEEGDASAPDISPALTCP
ncbi:BTAD domain-containing putative transcriptional regulator [Streptomyces sp. NPDC059002]|uniref:AfsR/SARP family transcriptional regulator n=1 Tax=Streptomyces sp. NPDC059002 TaxID=3346690 RepID=UPI00367FB02E